MHAEIKKRIRGDELTYEPMFEGEEVNSSLLDAEDEGVPSGSLVQRAVLLYPSPNSSSFFTTSAHLSAATVSGHHLRTGGPREQASGPRKTKQDRTEWQSTVLPIGYAK